MLSRRPTGSAAAASPIRAIFGVPVRSRRALDPHAGHQSGREAGARHRASMSIPRRRDRSCASAAATRAKASSRISSPRWCAPTAPSRTPRAARPMSPARKRCRSDLGEWQPTVEFLLGPIRLRQGSRAISRRWTSRNPPSATSMRSAGRVSARCWRSLPKACRCSLSSPVTQINTSARRRRRRDRQGPLQRACRHRHGVDQCADGRQDQVHAGSAASASSMRCDKLSLGSYDRIALELPGNPLGLQRDDLMFEKTRRQAHRGVARQCLAARRLRMSMSAG